MEDLSNATSSTGKILKKLGIGRADFNTIKNTHIKPRANTLPDKKEKQRIFSKIRNTKKGPTFVTIVYLILALKVIARLSEGMKKTSRRRGRQEEKEETWSKHMLHLHKKDICPINISTKHCILKVNRGAEAIT